MIPLRGGALADVLPRPSAANTFRVFVVDEGLDSPDLTLAAKRARLADIRARIGGPRLYVEVGVAIRFREGAREVYQAASDEGVRLAILAGASPHHTDAWLPAEVLGDPDNRQRLADGSYGLGAERGRYWASMSHYATDVRKARREYTLRIGLELAALAKAFPGTIACVIGPDEVGLSAAGYPDTYADYSRHSLEQFRDWSSGAGAYAPGGELAGQGQAEPAGYADAPRTPTPGAPRWEAWLAFRRSLVRAWTEDHVGWLIEAGLPPEMILPRAFLPEDPTWREFAGCEEPPTDDEGPLWVVDGARSGAARGLALDAPEDGQAPLDDTLRDLLEAGCGLVLLRPWQAGSEEIAQVAGGPAEAALRAYLDWRADMPLGSDAGDFTAPAVRGTEVAAEDATVTVSWSPLLFEGSALRWEDWGRFAYFVVRADGIEVGRTERCVLRVDGASPAARYTVEAVTE